LRSVGKIHICVLLVVFIAATGTLYGQDIKSRMLARLPQIIALKAKGVLGENNQGYLTLLIKDAADPALVTAENQDRRLIYQAIAKKENTTPELVGRRRALQIAQKAEPGDWIQKADGSWGRK
jgi:uncharacterized protein